MVTFQNLKNLGKKLSVQHNILKILLEEDKKKGHEKLLEETIAENVPNMGKEIATQVQETQSSK